ncbi:MAG: M6 family metalloprotease domain-containing protein [Bacteroidaceae bacterium]|nr:M6 family metalloprotease domain-containing protein [Bacteroidaceae bacterium]
MRRTLSILLTMGLAIQMMAVPAKRTQSVIRQKDGTQITVVQRGDEHFHYLVTTDGVPIAKDADGFYTYAHISNGRLAPTTQRAHEPAERSTSEAKYIQTNRETLDDGITTLWTQRANKRTASRQLRIEKVRATTQARYTKARAASTTTKKGLIILVNYSVEKMSSSTANADFYNMFNQHGYSKDMHIGSVRDYFYDQSYGQLTIDFDVVGPYNLSHDMAYYGGNDDNDDDLRPGEMVAEACLAADADVNYADYDWDGDGEVEQVFVIYAGYGEASASTGLENTIWPHEWELESSDYGRSLTLDGVTINTYACSNELTGASGKQMDGIGTACHEFSHCLGLPDFYDTRTNGSNFGMDAWSLMDYGCYNGPDGYEGCVPSAYTAYERYYSGWIEPTVLDEGTDINGMQAITDSPESYIIYNAANQNEYYMLFNIQQTSWNTYAYGHGMLVMHIDYDKSVWNANTVNNTSSRQRCTIIAADNSYSHYNLSADPFPGTGGNTSLTNTTTPAAKLYNKNSDGTKYLNHPIEDITETNGLISLKFNGGTQIEAPVASEPSGITATGFTANWQAVDDAQSYTLELQEVYEADVEVILSEDFSGIASLDSGKDISSKIGTYTSTSGWSGTKLFATGRDEVKLGSSSYIGSITTPTLSDFANGTVTVYIEGRPYGTNSTANFTIKVGSNEKSTSTTGDAIVVTTDAPDGNFTVTISTTSGNKRAYIDRIVICDGEATAEEVSALLASSSNAPKKAIRKTTYTGLTGTSYTFTNLTGKEYYYRVKALTATSSSAWSDLIHVILSSSNAVQDIDLDSSDKPARIYTLSGVFVKHADGYDWKTGLPKGIYIVKQGNRARKLTITHK